MEATNWSWHFSWVWSDMPRYAQSGDTIQIKNFVTCWVNVSIWKLKIDLVILDGCGQVCQGMVKVLRNNQWPISQEFCLEVFVNYSYHFRSIWSNMSGHPKVYKNNRSAISLSTKKYLVTVLVFLYVIRYPWELLIYHVIFIVVSCGTTLFFWTVCVSVCPRFFSDTAPE